jgi:hypothetical protein
MRCGLLILCRGGKGGISWYDVEVPGDAQETRREATWLCDCDHNQRWLVSGRPYMTMLWCGCFPSVVFACRKHFCIKVRGDNFWTPVRLVASINPIWLPKQKDLGGRSASGRRIVFGELRVDQSVSGLWCDFTAENYFFFPWLVVRWRR